jgi:hypothetical protein
MNKHSFAAAFLVGAMAVVWVGVGYAASHPLALVMTLIIGAVYGAGALELLHFRRATATLTVALANISPNLSREGLQSWLGTLHPSLQNAVRLRVEGERTGLPGPALTPYLVGLLVMLGMLGTFLGMVVTLNGAVFALEGTTDLSAMRSSLAAPIKGLGLAFGTSLAGVAASAMLGLMSALVRHERLQAGQMLDDKIATVLRPFSLAHQRQETFAALQQQAQALPAVVNSLQTMMTLMERQNQQLQERLLGNQDSFHSHVQGVYTGLAQAVDQSLKDSLANAARVAMETIQPLTETTLTGMAREAAALHERMVNTTQTQLDALITRVDAGASRMAGDAGLLHERLVQTTQAQLDALLTRIDASTSNTAHEASALHERMVGTTQAQLDALTARVDASASSIAQSWTTALAQQDSSNRLMLERVEQSQQHFSETFGQGSATLLAAVGATLTGLQTQHASANQEQLGAWTQSLESIAVTLQREWQQAGALTLAQQQHICTTLEATARQITAQAQTHSHDTLAEITRLLDTVAEAPRAAAEVIGQLRQELSSSMARDNAMLEERSRILETLNGLLNTIQHASTEQRASIDTLVASSAELLGRVGNQFADKVDEESARLTGSAAHVTSSAVEVASMGESFQFAVQLFNQANDKLIANLQRIESAMDKSMARSDDQLAYYVAQAREIIDLSIMSQKEVVDDLRALRQQPAALAGEVA